MKKVLVVTGSVRKNNVNSSVVELVKSRVEGREGVQAEVADLGELDLPFFNSPVPPAADGFEIEDERVRAWSELVKGADAVILVSPEYNHSLSAIQKNAIDWLAKEWTDKPMAFVAYGWSAGMHSLAQLKEIGTVIKWQVAGEPVGLQFAKDVETSGTIIAKDDVSSRVDVLVDALLAIA